MTRAQDDNALSADDCRRRSNDLVRQSDHVGGAQEKAVLLREAMRMLVLARQKDGALKG